MVTSISYLKLFKSVCAHILFLLMLEQTRRREPNSCYKIYKFFTFYFDWNEFWNHSSHQALGYHNSLLVLFSQGVILPQLFQSRLISPVLSSSSRNFLWTLVCFISSVVDLLTHTASTVFVFMNGIKARWPWTLQCVSVLVVGWGCFRGRSVYFRSHNRLWFYTVVSLNSSTWRVLGKRRRRRCREQTGPDFVFKHHFKKGKFLFPQTSAVSHNTMSKTAFTDFMSQISTSLKKKLSAGTADPELR